MQNLLIISQTQSYLWMSLQDKLQEHSLHVTYEKIDPNALNLHKNSVDGIILYVDGVNKASKNGFTYLKDLVLELDIPLFVIGDPESLELTDTYIPKHIVSKSFIRPINNNDVAAAIADFMADHVSHTRHKVLVVDDSGAFLRSVKGWLDDKYQVILANSGAMAIKYLATNRPDLVLLDYEMPVIDGKKVLEMIRSESEFSDIPVIFLTSKDDKESVMQVMALKPEGYLLKTLPPDTIVSSIDNYFELKKANES